MKRKKSGGGGANWMDTYGDMVTLLLCFFVLLYSMSSIDQNKWIQLVKSFNPDAVEQATESDGNNGAITDPSNTEGVLQLEAQQKDIDQAMELLYEQMQEYIAQQEGAAENISVTEGDGYVFISFNDAVFFEGDSYVLQPEGREVLDVVSELLSSASDAIDEIKVLGHTAQGTADEPNNPTVDRFLSSNRATVVLVYLQEHSTVEPGRLLSVGYGQWRPVAANTTSEERAKNRRVEILVTGLDLESRLGDSIAQYYTERSADADAANSGGETDAANTQNVDTP